MKKKKEGRISLTTTTIIRKRERKWEEGKPIEEKISA